MDFAALWSASHDRTVALTKDLNEEQAEATVPATDAWTIRQLLSHMVGVDDDALKNQVDEELGEDWTQHHVEDRKDRTTGRILDEWAMLAPKVQDLLATAPDEVAGNLVVDAYWHELDLRTGLGEPGAKDDPAFDIALGAFSGSFGQRVTEKGLPAVRLQAGDFSTVAGEGDPQLTLTADRFELGRALSGRRSAEQVRAFDWSGDPDPYLPIFSMFGELRPTDLSE